MFVVDELTAAAIRRAFDEGGELAGIVEAGTTLFRAVLVFRCEWPS